VQEQAYLIGIEDAPGRPTSGGGYLTFFAQQEGGFHCGMFTLPPGVRLGRKAMAHSGPEVYFVLQGTCWCDLLDTGQTFEIPAGHAFYIPAGTLHAPHNEPGDEEAIVFWTCAGWP